MLLKEQVKVLEEEKNKLEEELKCSNVYAGSLKSRFLLMTHWWKIIWSNNWLRSWEI